MGIVYDRFAGYLNDIKDKDFLSHVKNIIDLSPDYIINIPSSSTGKYHPSDEINPEGMIRHVTRFVVFAKELSRQFQLTQDEADVLIACAVLHDLYKSGNPQGRWTVAEHPILIYNAIKSYVISNKALLSENMAVLSKLTLLAVTCLFHEGQWTTKAAYDIQDNAVKLMNQEDRKLCDIAHTCDFLASRKSIFQVMQKDFDLNIKISTER